jgi:hypothetical protein
MMHSEDWVRYYDEEHSSYYLYNEKTGESVWEVDFMQEVTEASESSGLHNRSADTSETNSRKLPRTFRSKDYERDVPLTPAEQLQYDLLCYSRFLFVHATLVEAPLAIVEALLRVVAMVVVGLFRIIFLVCRGKRAKAMGTTMLYVREIILVSAAALSLAIPGLICAVYWNHSHEEEWELRPLPTLLGGVDMRRFAVISYGSGALASNAAGYTRVTDAAEQPDPGKSGVEHEGTNRRLVRIGSDNQDAWSGRLVWVPRELVADCSAFLRGRDSLESMDVEL